MKPGSVVVDLAAEQGGNCELTEPGQTIRAGESRVNRSHRIGVGARNCYSSVKTVGSQLLNRTKSIWEFACVLMRKRKQKSLLS